MESFKNELDQARNLINNTIENFTHFIQDDVYLKLCHGSLLNLIQIIMDFEKGPNKGQVSYKNLIIDVMNCKEHFTKQFEKGLDFGESGGKKYIGMFTMFGMKLKNNTFERKPVDNHLNEALKNNSINLKPIEKQETQVLYNKNNKEMLKNEVQNNNLLKPVDKKSEKDVLNEFLNKIQQKNIKIIYYSDLSFSRVNFIGKGGVGRVYKGQYKNNEVAIKEYYKFNIYDNFHEDGNTTIEILAEIYNCFYINIPQVNKCYGVSIDENGVLYSVHELAFCSLKEKLKTKLNLQTKHEITRQILAIMKSLYDLKIIHRDIKPENFLIMNDGNIQICDFGSIRQLHNEETHTYNEIYTVRYAPPEFINDVNIAGLYSDIWSLGLVLYEIYYGEDLWKGCNKDEISQNIKNNNIPLISYNPQVPIEIMEIIENAVKVNGKERINLINIRKKFEKIEK